MVIIQSYGGPKIDVVNGESQWLQWNRVGVYLCFSNIIICSSLGIVEVEILVAVQLQAFSWPPGCS